MTSFNFAPHEKPNFTVVEEIPPAMSGNGKPMHVVKSWTLFYRDVKAGIRTSDIRFTGDRRYKVGDYMLLREWDPVEMKYTDEAQMVEITYIQTNKSNPCAISDKALADDYAVLSIAKREMIFTMKDQEPPPPPPPLPPSPKRRK